MPLDIRNIFLVPRLLWAATEEEFEIDIPDEDSENIKTVGNIIK